RLHRGQSLALAFRSVGRTPYANPVGVQALGDPLRAAPLYCPLERSDEASDGVWGCRTHAFILNAALLASLPEAGCAPPKRPPPPAPQLVAGLAGSGGSTHGTLA